MLVLLMLSCAGAQGAEPVDVQHIIAQSVEANKRDWKADPQYDFCQRVLKAGHSRTFDVRMILGSPYNILTGVDDRPISSQDAAEEKSKLQREVTRRRNEPADQRSRRIADWQRSNQRDHFLEEQLTKAFDFKDSGQATVRGHNVFVLTATPKPGYQPPNRDTKVLTGMRGKLWIDQQTFQWVKVEAEVIHPVSIEGILARVEPGTKFELDEAPVTPDVWLATYFVEKARAKVFFVISKNSQEDDTYFDYQPAPSVLPDAAPRACKCPDCSTPPS